MKIKAGNVHGQLVCVLKQLITIIIVNNSWVSCRQPPIQQTCSTATRLLDNLPIRFLPVNINIDLQYLIIIASEERLRNYKLAVFSLHMLIQYVPKGEFNFTPAENANRLKLFAELVTSMSGLLRCVVNYLRPNHFTIKTYHHTHI